MPGEWRRKWGETGISLIPAIRAARFTRFYALTALIGKTNFADGLVGPQCLKFSRDPAREPHDAGLAAFAGHVRHPVD